MDPIVFLDQRFNCVPVHHIIPFINEKSYDLLGRLLACEKVGDYGELRDLLSWLVKLYNLVPQRQLDRVDDS